MVAKTSDQGESKDLFSEDLWCSKMTHLLFSANFWCRKGLKQWAIQCLIVTDINYSLVHSAAENHYTHQKYLAKSSREIHP